MARCLSNEWTYTRRYWRRGKVHMELQKEREAVTVRLPLLPARMRA